MAQAFFTSVLLVSWYFLLKYSPCVEAHGRLMDPPARNAMWRFGYPNPVNYNDNELFCGGYAVQWEQNDGRCGVCGDAHHLREPRPHEAGGEYARGVIARRYLVGQQVEVEVELTANHWGRFELRLCPNNNHRYEATQECLDRYPLYVSGSREFFEIPRDARKKAIFRYKVTLPAYVTCTQCVLQWTYYTGNMWGTCPNGTEAVGCGRPETFRNCADVSIVSSTGGGGVPPLFVSLTNHNALLLSSPAAYSADRGQVSANLVSNTLTTSPSFAYEPDQLLDYEIVGIKGLTEHPYLLYYKDHRAPTSDNVLPLVVRDQVCLPTALFKRTPGMEIWCQTNCLRYPPNCPELVCQCPQTCDAIGELDGREGADVYCQDACINYPSKCPEHRCKCY